MIACMGGFCGRRNGCAHYVTEDRRDPVERLCEPGHDDPDPIPQRVIRPAGTWERKDSARMLKPACPMGVLG